MNLALTSTMALAAYRVYRLVGADEITKRPRQWLVKRSPSKLDLFITCPWCAGFWISLGTVVVVDQFAVVELPALQVAAVSCIVGLIGENLDSG